jgi:adenosylcobinamide-phosphate synthase
MGFARYSTALERSFNSGRYQHGVLAWLFAVAPIVACVAAVSRYLDQEAPVLVLIFNIAVLYLAMGFRHFSHAYNEALSGLRVGDPVRARSSIQTWFDRPLGELSASEVAALAIERGLFSAHRQVFGVIAWFALFGAAGAVLYRLASMLSETWGRRNGLEDADFGRFSRTAFQALDWIPARLTAVSFAIVGDFEDALYCWRTQAKAWPDHAEGVVLASGAGAIGVRLGSVPRTLDAVELRSEIGMGDMADAELMTSAVGLIWRALVLWLFVIVLVTVASWLG